MKKNTIAVIAAFGLTSAMAITGFAAEAQTEAVTEAQTEADTEAPAIETIDVQLTGNTETTAIENHTSVMLDAIESLNPQGETEILYGQAFDDGLSTQIEAASEASSEISEADIDSENASQEQDTVDTVNLIVCNADDDVLRFFNVGTSSVSLIKLYQTAEGTSFVTEDQEGHVLTDTTASPMTGYDEPRTMYATEYVYVRSQANKDSEPLGTLQYVDQVTADASSANGWIMIEFEGGYGFVYGDYLSEDIADAQAALSAEEAAQAQAAAEAAAAQAAAQQAASNQNNNHSSHDHTSTRTIVSQENVPNCDDGSHGTTFITYSDGTVEEREY